MPKKKRLWFSITDKEFIFKEKRGTGKGGQKRNKTSSAIQCTHKFSGAVGEAENSRSQLENKQAAFRRCVATKEFQGWLKLLIEAGLGNVQVDYIDEVGKPQSRLVTMEDVYADAF